MALTSVTGPCCGLACGASPLPAEPLTEASVSCALVGPASPGVRIPEQPP